MYVNQVLTYEIAVFGIALVLAILNKNMFCMAKNSNLKLSSF